VTVRVLVIGDVVGPPGLDALVRRLPSLRAEKDVDFCVANIENTSNGSGVEPAHLDPLLQAGVNVFTSGDHIYGNKRIFQRIGKDPRLLRPANLAPEAIGPGYGVFEVREGVRILVVNLLGRIFMKPIDCPFHAASAILEKTRGLAQVSLIDFHAEATAEKAALARYLDGRASAVIGTHTHVPTADAAVLPGGTAFITDIGMTGPHDSVIGRRADRVIHFMTTQMPVPFDVATGDIRISGVLLDLEPATGKATGIEFIQVRAEDKAP